MSISVLTHVPFATRGGSMKTLHFATIIHATREAVWDAMLAPETYKIWTP